jgi:hypothetical protein
MGPAGAAVTQNEIVPMAFPVDNPCTGDLLWAGGDLHIVESVTYDRNGGVHTIVHTNYQGWTAEVISGPNVGAEYVASNSPTSSNNMKKGETKTTSQVINFVGKGHAPNVKVRFLQHITVNANGEVTAEVDVHETTCK